jgi:hypothetical protein
MGKKINIANMRLNSWVVNGASSSARGTQLAAHLLKFIQDVILKQLAYFEMIIAGQHGPGK